jgi:hypothetical protein
MQVGLAPLFLLFVAVIEFMVKVPASAVIWDTEYWMIWQS